jgi:hypothetical protein
MGTLPEGWFTMRPSRWLILWAAGLASPIALLLLAGSPAVAVGAEDSNTWLVSSPF